MAQLVKTKKQKTSCNVRDLGLISGLGISTAEGNGYPLQYSGLENSMDCIVHGVTKSQTRLSNSHLLPQSYAFLHWYIIITQRLLYIPWVWISVEWHVLTSVVSHGLVSLLEKLPSSADSSVPTLSLWKPYYYSIVLPFPECHINRTIQ